jgi:WhiB family transcriptional regulator, redox-sensing transcriptional regulator
MTRTAMTAACGTASSMPEKVIPMSSPLMPTEEAWSWQTAARCRGEDASIFFHPDGERGRAAKRRQDRAKAICAECSVAAECREYALRYQEPFGVWGGLSEHERLTLLGRHRPRTQRDVSVSWSEHQ